MQKFILLLLVLVATVALVGLFSISGAVMMPLQDTNIRELRGIISDKNGKNLPTGQMRASAPDGTVIGQGEVDQIKYQLQLAKKWIDYPILNVEVNSVRHSSFSERTYKDYKPMDWLSCTEINVQQLLQHARMSQAYIVVDLQCDKLETFAPFSQRQME